MGVTYDRFPHGKCEIADGCEEAAIFRLAQGKSCMKHKPESVVFAPFLGQQEKFFQRRERVVFFGGSAGPGKSLCLLMKFGQQLAVDKQRHAFMRKRGKNYKSTIWGLYLRRTTPNLKQAKTWSRSYMPAFDPAAKFVEDDGIWTFPSAGGATFQFGHMEHERDKYKFKSSQYCAAGGTRVVMADGSLQAIEAVLPGEQVMTLEGPRTVTATWDTGVQPCVSVTTRYQGAIVGTQVHPTTHPVLAWTNSESMPSPLPGAQSTALRSRPRGLVWQDFESLLGGAQESPEKRVSRVVAGSGFATSDGSRQELSQLAPLTFPVALHASTVRRCSRSAASATECRTNAASSRPSADRLQAQVLPGRDSDPFDRPGCATETPAPACTSAPPGACGGSDGLPGTETPRGSQGRCSSSSDLRDGQPRRPAVDAQGDARRPGDAASQSPTGLREDGRGRPPTHTPYAGPSYPHFYSGLARAATEEILPGEAEIQWHGYEQTFDLTVDDANHYITEFGLINCQTYIAFDELTEFSEDQYEYMDTRLRTTDPELEPYLQMLSASNPDGEGLAWVRERFIEVAPPETVVRIETKLGDGRIHSYDQIFIPAKLTDNPVLLASGSYEAALRNKRPEVREALLNGNWYVSVGAYFGSIWNSDLHVVEDHDIPDGVKVFRSGDWGIKSPSSIGWWYEDSEGGLTCFAHLRTVGMNTDKVALEVKRIEQRWGLWNDNLDESRLNYSRSPLDSACFANHGFAGAPTIAKDFAKLGVRWKPAKKGPGSRYNGLAQMVRRFGTIIPAAFDGATSPTERARPMLRFAASCKSPIRTIPTLQADPSDPNDVDTKGDDHDTDMTIYACLENAIHNFDEREEMEDEDELLIPQQRSHDRLLLGDPIR